MDHNEPKLNVMQPQNDKNNILKGQKIFQPLQLKIFHKSSFDHRNVIDGKGYFRPKTKFSSKNDMIINEVSFVFDKQFLTFQNFQFDLFAPHLTCSSK